MINLKTAEEIKLMREAGRISALALREGGKAVKDGVTTEYVDDVMRKFIKSYGATASFLGENGFPAASCISVNDEVIHVIPGRRVIKTGDIVSIDVGACINGFHGDNACTFACGKISDEARRLLDVTKESLQIGIKTARIGTTTGDIGFAIQKFVESKGFSVVKNFVGHGIGRAIHEEPNVPNFGNPGEGTKLEEGMTIAIEPMVNAGNEKIRKLSDGWGVVTDDGSLSAHFENTVVITKNGAVILTNPE
jgi:methionyl aminopeptidase